MLLSLATVVVMAALCRGGQQEDVRLGYDATAAPRPQVFLPGPRGALDNARDLAEQRR